MALDLSAKTFGDSSKPPSPVPCSSPGSDTSTYDKLTASALSGLHVDRLLNQATRHPQQTVDGFPEAGFALAGGVRPAPTTAAGHLLLQAKAERLSPLSPDGPRDVGRPFRNYPIEAMSTMYSQMAASAASMSAAGMYSQYGGAASSPAFIDNFLSSPIAQYLQQKKRRSDCRGKGSGGGNGGVGGIDVAALPLAPSVDVSLAGDDAYYSQLPNVSMSSPGDRSSGDNRSPLGDLDHDTPGKRQRTSSDSFCGVANMSIEERRDESYWERRRKNNEAAKRSRDARRQKEEEIALRAAFLEQENLKLHAQVTILKNETAKLHYMLYNRM